VSDEARAVLEAIKAVSLEERVEIAVAWLLAATPTEVEAAADALPDRAAATLAALFLAPQLRRAAEAAPQGSTH
jgi:hypothetical protein